MVIDPATSPITLSVHWPHAPRLVRRHLQHRAGLFTAVLVLEIDPPVSTSTSHSPTSRHWPRRRRLYRRVAVAQHCWLGSPPPRCALAACIDTTTAASFLQQRRLHRRVAVSQHRLLGSPPQRRALAGKHACCAAPLLRCAAPLLRCAAPLLRCATLRCVLAAEHARCAGALVALRCSPLHWCTDVSYCAATSPACALLPRAAR